MYIDMLFPSFNVCYTFVIVVFLLISIQQVSLEEVPAKKLRLTKPSKSAALHLDLCKASSPTDALQHLLSFARKPVEAESVEGVARILLEHYYKVKHQNNPVTCYIYKVFHKLRQPVFVVSRSLIILSG